MRFEFSNPFSAPGEWLRGNLHTHSTASDGIRSPQEVVDHYALAGYDFLAITDHGIITDPKGLDPRGMLLIPSQEISLGCSEVGTTFHIVAVGIEKPLVHKDFDLGGDPQRAVDDIKKQGGIAVLAHPYWSGLAKSDMFYLDGYDGVEIYNANCEVYNGAGDSRPHIDAVLAKGRHALILAVDDHHGTPEPMKIPDSLLAWINVKAKRNQPSLVAAIRAGLFYASTGPQLRNIKIEDDTIVAETTPVTSIGFISSPSRGTIYWANGNPITEASYKPRKHESYIRVEATDENGRTAYSNPIYVYDK